MKKRIFHILLVILSLVLIFSLFSCFEHPIDQKECKHDFGEWYVIIEGTCAKGGELQIEARHCHICDYREERSVKIDHDVAIMEGFPPTCITTGATEGSWCPKCGEIFVPQKEIPSGHVEVYEKGVDPTCTTDGWTEWTYCSACGEVLVDKRPIPAQHTEVVDKDVKPTCTTTGLTEGSHCSVCGEILLEQRPVPALGHTNSDHVVENYLAPDCENTGSYDSVVYCSICDEELSRKTIKIDALGHTEVSDEAVNPTCTTAGLTEGSHCSVCGEILLEQRPVPALGHTNSDLVVENYLAPDCENAGSYDSVVYCSICDEELSRKTIKIDALGHTEVIDVAVEPTCGTTGLTAGSHCSTCDKVFVKQEIVSPLDHTEVVDESVKPTCTKVGYTQGSHCSVCKGVIIEQTVIPATGHSKVDMADAVIEDYIAPDCENNGSYSSVVYCKICGVEIFRTSSSIDALGHDVVVDSRVEPTCTESGFTEGSHCSVCGEVFAEQEVISATGHDEVIQAAVAPTCTSTGLTEGKYCKICGEILAIQEKLEKAEHNYVGGNCKDCKVTSCEYFTFTLLPDDTYSIKAKSTNLPSNVVIPSEYEGKSITEIGYGAFENCTTITSIIVPNSVTSIYSGVFWGCSSLESITIPFEGKVVQMPGENNIYPFGALFGNTEYVGGTKTMQYYYEGPYFYKKSAYYYVPSSLKNVTLNGSGLSKGAFYNCSNITSINLPYISVIEESTFYGCSSLNSIVIPNTVHEIGSSAFEYCGSLNSIIIPSTVHKIGNYAFQYCSSLNNITMYAGAVDIAGTAFTGTAYYKNENNWTNGVLYIGSHLIKAKETISGKYVIKSSTSNIANSAFESCKNLTEIVIPSSVKQIGDYAFANCSSLAEIVIPNSVETIGDYAFVNCTSLANVKVVSVVFISEGAFRNCTSLTSIVVPGSIGDYAFYGCKNLTQVTIGDRAKVLGSYAFYGCEKLANVIIPDNVKAINDYAFYDCDNLTSVVIGNRVELIGNYAFYCCSELKDVIIPTSVTSIGNYAFYGCLSISDIEIPVSVVSIGSSAFECCYRLSTVKLNNMCTKIGNKAFSSCSANVYTTYGYGKYVGDEDNPYSILIEVTNKTLSTYEIHPDTYIIASNTFQGCSNLTNITIPDSVFVIDDYAFRNCNKLESVSIGKNVRIIGVYAFGECTSLTNVVIPNNTRTIDGCAFYGCQNISKVTVGFNVATIGNSAFQGDNAITDIYYVRNEEEWSKIEIGHYNTPFTTATIHYNYVPEE